MSGLVTYGIDSSGRPILMTTFMRDWWLGVVERLGFEPTIVQGAWMRQAGGGAAASAGYHDLGGCLDLRVWNLKSAQVDRTIRELRRSAAAAWVRDARHGMDPHIHLVLGTDTELADGAAWQWVQYLAGRDGLSSGGRDYHWRPDPIVTVPPEDDMAEYADKLDAMHADIKKMLERETTRDRAELARHKKRHDKVMAGLASLEEAVADDATKRQVRKLREDLADPGEDAPSP